MTHSLPSRWKVSRQAGLLIIHWFYSFESVFGARSLSHNQSTRFPRIAARFNNRPVSKFACEWRARGPFEVEKSRRNRRVCYAYTRWNKRAWSRKHAGTFDVQFHQKFPRRREHVTLRVSRKRSTPSSMQLCEFVSCFSLARPRRPFGSTNVPTSETASSMYR